MFCSQMPLRAKATSKKLDIMSICLTYRGEEETQGDKVLPAPAKKPLFISPISLKSIPLLTSKGEIYSFSAKREREYQGEKKKQKQKTPPHNCFSQLISHLKDLFGSDKLSQVASGTIYHVSSCIYWWFQERSGMSRHILLTCTEGCLHSSLVRSCLKQKNADFHGSSKCYLGRSRLLRAFLMWEHGIPPHFPPILSKASQSTARPCCAGTNTTNKFWKSKIIFLPLFVFRIMALWQAE